MSSHISVVVSCDIKGGGLTCRAKNKLSYDMFNMVIHEKNNTLDTEKKIVIFWLLHCKLVGW